VRSIADRVHAGNIYVNRNQIGAVVGSQPFGGEGLSGTGPKAGGPHYLPRLRKRVVDPTGEDVRMLPGPTGESNFLTLEPRGLVLCLGPTDADRDLQIELAEAAGNATLVANAFGVDVDAVMYFGDDIDFIRAELSARDGAIIPLITSPLEAIRLSVERHVCIDTTAAGGNASLMASAQES
jgi:RHH-type proline utilization regulon transcriptional repressor/proline dehydrogenase/delta 1-pyrroline-5-carboxylate dehydrogenase